jgi:hypothetical protein
MANGGQSGGSRTYTAAVSILCLLLLTALVTLAAGKEKTAGDDKWWPSEWGPDDQRGAANRMTPQKVLEATRLIHTG